jgi:hypothetical protein
MVNANDVFAEWNRAVAEVADLVRVPADRRRELWEELSSYNDAATEWDRLEVLARWRELSEGDRRALENARRKLLSAYNAARALTPAQRKCADAVGQPSDWVEKLEIMTWGLASATCVPIPSSAPSRPGRPKGRTSEGMIVRELIGMIESCGGKLPSVDHDPGSIAINKVIKILQPHFPPGDLRPISASTFRRAKKEVKAQRK